MRLLPATILILGALGATAGCGDRESEAPAALPPSGTAYRKLSEGARLAVAAGCRDRAAAKADGVAPTSNARDAPMKHDREVCGSSATGRGLPSGPSFGIASRWRSIRRGRYASSSLAQV